MLPTLGTKASMWFNFAASVFGLAQQSGVVDMIPGQYSGYVMMGMGVLNALAHMGTGNVPIVGTPSPAAPIAPKP